MENVKILYGVQGNGMTFGLDLNLYFWIKEHYPKAQPARRIFVEYDMKSDFADYHANLESYIFPALMGFPTNEELKKIKKIEFVKTPEMRITYTIEQNYEQEKQLIPG
jgi:hypothetical protein